MLFLGLWELRNGGYIVARSLLDGDAPKATADKAENLETAMLLIEAATAALEKSAGMTFVPGDLSPTSFGQALQRLQSRSERRHSFMKLAGEALDDWQRLVGTEFDSTH
ncbi:hypothetical protein RGUI_4048 [Rhodovulum sp. P5]|nr:hypothetical protein RGUI_4048 [Rhodovulum sp. P5]